MSVWLVTVPNNKENSKTTFTVISNSVKQHCELYRFKTPSLTVGTLDSLIALSDDLAKISTQVEVSCLFVYLVSTCGLLILPCRSFCFSVYDCNSFNLQNVVRKVERQYFEISTPDKDGKPPKPLVVNDVAVDVVFTKFQWNTAQFQTEGKQLGELVSQIQGIAGKTDEELKVLGSTYSEKNLALAAAKRRQIINLSTSEFEDFLAPETIAKLDVLNTDNLLTVTIVVPKSAEQG
jgi:V-type H+-transporting ATPase subunit C